MGFVKLTVKSVELGVDKRLKSVSKRAESIMAIQAAKDTEDYVPMLTGSLKNRTLVKDNMIIYTGPYARYLYYGKVMVDSSTGKGPMHFTDKMGNEVIRFRKGARLQATNRDLKFTKAYHKNAQSFWFEASKAQNLEKWRRIAARVVSDEF